VKLSGPHWVTNRSRNPGILGLQKPLIEQHFRRYDIHVPRKSNPKSHSNPL
jgi:hypothetical protein